MNEYGRNKIEDKRNKRDFQLESGVTQVLRMGFMFTLPDVRRCWMSLDSADHTAGKSGSSCQQSMAETLARLALRRFQTPPVFGVFQAFSAFFSGTFRTLAASP